MAIVNEDGFLSVINDDGYQKELSVLDGGETGLFYIGMVRTPKFFIGKKVILEMIVVNED